MSLRTLKTTCCISSLLFTSLALDQTALGQAALEQDVRVEVFGLFRPRELTLSPARGSALIVQARGQTFVLEEGSVINSMRILGVGDRLKIEIADRVLTASAVHVAARTKPTASFELQVPTKIRRVYSGTLEISSTANVLRPVVTMNVETAVASVVQAESDAGTPIEALKAQAVAARSYFLASKGRHRNSNFCDTTHCQFMREAPTLNSAAATAAMATRGLVLVYFLDDEERPITAMYTRSCGGRTKTPSEIGLSTNGYPYFSVACRYCAQNPVHWSRHYSRADVAELVPSNETSRLRIDRTFGWNAVPSNTFSLHGEQQDLDLEGTGQGHGVGMCQRGARAMAEQGATFHDILNHYYPNTRLIKAKLNQ